MKTELIVNYIIIIINTFVSKLNECILNLALNYVNIKLKTKSMKGLNFKPKRDFHELKAFHKMNDFCAKSG